VNERAAELRLQREGIAEMIRQKQRDISKLYDEMWAVEREYKSIMMPGE
jgi:hypothetical protein